MSRYLLFLLAAGTLSAQAVSFGVKVGAPLTDPSGNVRTSKSYSAGPSVEVRLSGGFAIEGSAILHHFSSTSFFQATTIGAGTNTIGTGTNTIVSGTNLIPIGTNPPESQTVLNHQRGNSWEFPVLVKRYFRMRTNRWEPYVGAGGATRTVGYRGDGTIQATSGGVSTVTSFVGESRSGLGLGATFEAGVRTRVGRVALLPEVRYTHWASRQSGLNKEDVGVNLGFRF